MTPARALRATPAISALPWVLLLAYGIAFAWAAIGADVPLFDDHPGQVARVWHVVNYGPAPWAWNPTWWAGYPELQFYPPAFSYAGALLHAISFGAVSVPGAYTALVWLAYLAPGAATLFALTRVQRSPWLALPGAFVALSLSLWPALESGVEGGIHVGMAPARLGWAMLPLMLGVLVPWAEGAARFPARAIVPIAALLVLMHPVHLPAAVVLVFLAALVRPPRGRRMLIALGWLVVAAMLTAFWTLPLVARVAETRALAWRAFAEALNPTLAVALALLAARALLVARASRSGSAWTTALFPFAMALVVGIDAAVLEPNGIQLLPADRVMDSEWLALVLAASVGALGIRGSDARPSLARQVERGLALALALVVVALLVPVLSLWPNPSEWSGRGAAVARLPMGALWRTLRDAPPGRVLFVRSGVPLVEGPNWWRPHSHITALAPVESGRAIVNGTFTHPSPVAAFVYRGDAGRSAITTLVERHDGLSLFGQPLRTIDAATLEARARRMRVSTIVALEDDVPWLPGLASNAAFAVRRSIPPFVVWEGKPQPLPQPAGNGRWRVATPAGRTGDWVDSGFAYYPLWHAISAGGNVATRRGEDGMLEVQLPAGALELVYRPGWPELAGVGITALGAVAWLLLFFPGALAVAGARGARLPLSDTPLQGASKT